MRNFIIMMFFSLMTRRNQRKLITNLKNSYGRKKPVKRRGSRGPYKKRKQASPVEVELPIEIPSKDERKHYQKVIKNWAISHPEASDRKPRQSKYRKVLSKMKRGDTKIFFEPSSRVSPALSMYKKIYGGDFELRTIGKNTVEVTKTI